MIFIYWGIYDNYTIKKIKPKTKKSLLIRALEPSYLENGIPYEIEYLDEYLDVLDLYFDDISKLIPNKKYNQYIQFNEEMAIKLISFISKYDFKEINVHCGAEISRSSALMICISKIIEAKSIEDEIILCGRYIPNRLVLSIFNNIFSDKNQCIIEDKFINSNKKEFQNGDNDLKIIKNNNGKYSVIL